MTSWPSGAVITHTGRNGLVVPPREHPSRRVEGGPRRAARGSRRRTPSTRHRPSWTGGPGCGGTVDEQGADEDEEGRPSVRLVRGRRLDTIARAPAEM